MKFGIKMRIVSVMLVIAIIVGLFSTYEPANVYAEGSGSDTLTIDRVIERFSVASDFIAAEEAAGYSIHQVYAALFRAEKSGISYESAKLALYPEETNLSSQTEGEVSNAQLPLDVVLSDPDVQLEGELYDPEKHQQISEESPLEEMEEVSADPEEEPSSPSPVETPTATDTPVDSPEPTEHATEEPSATPIASSEIEANSVEETSTQATDSPDVESSDDEEQEEEAGEEGAGAQVVTDPMSAMAISGVQEAAPVYNKSSFNQAPYSINKDQESISTLTGDMSLHQTDMTLPGRNGLSFSLTRTYNSSDAALHDLDHGYETYPETLYKYFVQFNAIRKQQLFNIVYQEVEYLEVDFDGNGTVDNTSWALDWYDVTHSTYPTIGQAGQVANQGISYSTPSESRTETTYLTSSTNSFVSSISYNQSGFSGTLYKSGSSFVTSGSYTPADSRTETSTCSNNKVGVYNAQGIWTLVSSDPDCPDSKSYNSGGYTGTLYRTTTDTLKICPSTGTPNWQCTKMWRANYSGTVAKPASDTRVYRQNYSGTVTKPGTNSTVRYGSWQGTGTYKERIKYVMSNVRIIATEGSGVATTRSTLAYEDYGIAQSLATQIQNSPGGLAESSGGYNYYVSSSPGTSIQSIADGTTTGYRYINKTKQPLKEKLYAIGKGWSWNLPFVESENGKQYVHLADGGRYEVENGTLKDYTWQGLIFAQDNTASAGGETSQYVLSSVDGTLKQYFTSDGRLLQTKDAYQNTITFAYTNHPLYGTKMLSSITDSIGNLIAITYTATEVRLAKGNETVIYVKEKLNNTEILKSVQDAEGRLTTFSYQIAPAKFNLIGNDEGRALSNPYVLLNNVVHPTGANTSYTYEPSPVKRFIGASSFKEAYRMSSRADVLTYANNTTRRFNEQSMTYTGDFAQSYGQNATFSTTLLQGGLSTAFNYRSAFVSDSQPTQYYLETLVASGGGITKTTTNSYAKKVGSRTYAVAYPTTVVTSDNKTSDTVTSTVEYDDYGNVTKSTDGLGAVTTNTYDPAKRWLTSTLQQVESNQYLYTDYTRNAQGSLTGTTVRKTNATGEILRQVTYGGFDSFGNATTSTVANGTKSQVFTISYDSLHHAYPEKQSIVVKDANGISSTITTQLKYDVPTGRILASIDGKNAKTDYAYDKLGRIKTVTYPNQTTLSAVYDDAQNTVTVADELGRKSRTQFNGLGWQQEQGVFLAGGYKRLARTDYYSNGQIEWTEDTTGNITRHEYDAWSRPTKTIAPNLSASTIAYNDALREVTATDALNNQVFEVFDKFGRTIRTEEKAAGGIRMTVSQTIYYPVNGRVQQQKDAKLQNTTYAYDLLGQLTSVTNAKNETTQYRYDLLGNHTKTIFPDLKEVNRTYDELGRLIENIDPQNKKDTYFYDANGNRSRLIDKLGQSFTYGYDSRNWLKSKVGPTETISFDYYVDGSRKWMNDSTGTTNYLYKPYTGELEKVTYPDGKTIQYTYNDAGQRTGMITPFGDIVVYGYNAINQLETLKWNGAVESSYTYKSNGQLWQAKLGGVVQAENTYTNGLLKELKQVGLQGSFNRTYTYERDKNKNIIDIAEKNQSTVTRDDSFTYDALDRVETASAFKERYSYDKRGNRQTLESDQSLNLTGGVDYEYDKWDRLTKVTRQGSPNVSYRYNGDNLMVERTENGQTTRYYYDGQNIVAEGLVQANGTVIEKVSYLRGHGLAMLEEADGTKGYYVHNGHGDVEAILGENGQTLNSYTYDIWGKPLTASETVANSFRYSGEYWDETTDLQYLRARWYDPSIGRFINEDTYEGEITNPLSLNLYTYVYNNPLIYIDPSGHKLESAYGYDNLLNEFVRGKASQNSYMWNEIEGAKKKCNTSSCISKMNEAQAKLAKSNDGIRNDPCNYLPAGCAGGKAEFVRSGEGYFIIELTLEGSTYDFSVAKDLGVFQCNCFTAGTTVLTDKGEKPIEKIKIGDKVLARNDKTGEMSYQEVELLFRKDVEETYNITVNGETITTTDEHPFWIKDKGWVKAKDLEIGQKLLTNTNEELEIEKIEVKKQHTKVYNFRVKNYHTYYVSNLHIWTHNKDSCGDWSYGPANTHVYYGILNGQRVYVGITNNLERRAREHGQRFDRLEPITEEPVQRRQARAIETYIRNTNPSFQNAMRSIGAYRSFYGKAMQWAQDWSKNNK